MVHYYGYYRNAPRGKRKKADQDELIPYIIEGQGSSREYRKSWARLIQKIYEVDPLICPKLVLNLPKECQGRMKILAFIEDEEVIRKILKHLGLWDRKPRPPPKENQEYCKEITHLLTAKKAKELSTLSESFLIIFNLLKEVLYV
jgi:hypothetical protein